MRAVTTRQRIALLAALSIVAACSGGSSGYNNRAGGRVDALAGDPLARGLPAGSVPQTYRDVGNGTVQQRAQPSLLVKYRAPDVKAAARERLQVMRNNGWTVQTVSCRFGPTEIRAGKRLPGFDATAVIRAPASAAEPQTVSVQMYAPRPGVDNDRADQNPADLPAAATTNDCL